VVFLALWGWRELGIRVAKEHTASSDAENRQLKEENARLVRLNHELATATIIFTVTGPQEVSARVFVDPQDHAVLIVSNAAKGTYELSVAVTNQTNPLTIAKFEIPASGEKAITLDHLPPQATIKSFALAAR
jgi:hypothetical protein